MLFVRLGLGYQRAVKQIFNDGSFREFPSIAEARRVTGINHIWKVCQGLQAHVGGYRWEYVNNDTDKRSKLSARSDKSSSGYMFDNNSHIGRNWFYFFSDAHPTTYRHTLVKNHEPRSGWQKFLLNSVKL